MKIASYSAVALMLLGSVCAYGQSDSSYYLSMSLEELLNIQIVSVSKKAESLFEAPLSASVLTKEEIERSGATSIMEALRLFPGVIVRQQTNGNYDIHIRGLDNMPPNSLILSSGNTTTLVMIDNRPVYNYLQGGIFWESLPIDLNDVEQIELVRGPASTLYGPNAVSGVINIITRTPDKNKLNVRANAQAGSLQTSLGNLAVGYQPNSRFNVTLSGNYQERGREVRYLDLVKYTWYNTIDSLSTTNASERFPHPDRSMIKQGANIFSNYSPKEKVKLSFAAGLQESEVQTVTFDNSLSNINTVKTETKYAEVRGSVYGLNGHFSYAGGFQSPVVGFTGSGYDFNTLDALLEYEVSIKGLSLKPGLIYRNAIYDDTKYWDASIKEGAISGKREMETYAASLRAEYKLLNDKLRLTAGVRSDKFTYPEKWFYSYQGAVSYRLNDRNMLRAVYSRAYRSPFIMDTYQDINITSPLPPPAPAGLYSDLHILGNKNLQLLNSTMFEIGYRSRFSSKISADVEVYSTKTTDYSSLVIGASEDTPQNYPVVVSTIMQFQNLPLWVRQTGVSLSMNVIAGKIQLKPFVTLQKTTLYDYSIFSNTSDASPGPNNNGDPAQNNIYSGIGSEIDHKFTPSVYGGAVVNYQPNSKFNVNLNAYYFSSHTFLQFDNLTYQDGVRGVEHIDSKINLNATVSYAPSKLITVFVNARNILNDQSVEYYRGDKIQGMILGGVRLQY